MKDSHINKNYFQNMSQKEKIWQFSSDANTAKFAYDTLIRHLNAAKIQVRRIDDAIKLAAKNRPQEPDLSNFEDTKRYFEHSQKSYDLIFIDVHFYFVAWTNCQNMMKTLASLAEFSEASFYYNSVKKHFDSYSEARNTFEHFHDRLPAGKFHHKVKEVQEQNAGPRRIFGGLRNGCYVFSDKSWDISSNSYNLLEKLVNEFLEKIHHSVNEKCNELLKST